MTSKAIPPVVLVVWEDAHSEDAWTSLEDLDTRPLSCQTVGYLVQKTKRVVTVSSTLSEDGQACCTLHIPRAWVRELRYLDRRKR